MAGVEGGESECEEYLVQGEQLTVSECKDANVVREY